VWFDVGTSRDVGTPTDMGDMRIYKSNDLVGFHVDPAAPEKAWQDLRVKCPALSEWGVTTLRKGGLDGPAQGLDGFVQSIILEPLYICKDHRNLHSNFYSKKFVETTSVCSRLHFFNQEKLQPKDLLADEEKFRKNYLGFSVVRPVKEACLGRTVIDPWKIGRGIDNEYYLLRTRFRAQVNGAILDAEGYPWTSQDGDATLCAHSALWGVCRYLSQRYPQYRELYPFDFIRMTESSEGRAVPYRGMTYTDYCRILGEFGTFPVVRVVQKANATLAAPSLDAGAFQDLYSYVESGFPVLASLRLPGNGHVISLVGHTMDLDKPVGGTVEFVDSSHFLKQFVVVDDNYFPYQTLGYEGDLEDYAVSYNRHGFRVSLSSVRTMTCPLPEKVFVPAEDARVKAEGYCRKFSSNLKQTGSAPFVTRLFVTSGASFKKRKLAQARRGPDGAASVPVGLHLPHFVWVMEVSPVDLFKKGLCTCEIVLDATAGALEEGVIYVRIGNQVHFEPHKATHWVNIDDAPKQYSQYTHNLGEKNAA